MSTTADALIFITDRYKSKCRTGTKVPYVVHPLLVSKMLAEKNCNDELLTAALLHDIIDHTDTKLKEIEILFGTNVSELVKGFIGPYMPSDSKEYIPYKFNKGKENLADFILAKATLDQILLLLADNLDEVRMLNEDFKWYGENAFNYTEHGWEGEKFYYYSILRAFQSKSFHPLEAYSSFLKEYVKIVNELF